MMRIVAYFASLPALERAAHAAPRAGWRTVAVRSPAFDERVLEIGHATHSPVPIVAMAGGVAGLLAGLVLTVGTVRQWPGLIVSGKPLVSVPPFLIIMFELTILIASIGAVWSFLAASARARRATGDATDPLTTDNLFSLTLESADGEIEVTDDAVRGLEATKWRQV
jgi:hypothetical protein